MTLWGIGVVCRKLENETAGESRKLNTSEVGGENSRREPEVGRQPGQRVKPAVTAAEGSLDAPDDT